MNNSISYDELYEATVALGGAFASAWSAGAEKFTLAAEELLISSGQTVLTETQKFDLFALKQAEALQELTAKVNVWANAADSAGSTGIGDIMRKYRDLAAIEANKVISGLVDRKDWLDDLVARANIDVAGANRVIAKSGGMLGHVFGPVVDAGQMIAGALEFQQTGISTSWENACAGVGVSWAAAAMSSALVLGAATMFALTAPSLLVVSVVALGAAAGSYFGGQYFQGFKNAILENRGFIAVVDTVLNAAINSNFLNARNFVVRRDPLVLDLDGDGLELTAASGNVLFDHNADGIKTGTGWAKADDGFLVRDLNGNGVIDSGRELFGVDTLKSNGQLATQGFDALADLDSNADGQITSADAAWSQLQVWRDLNQDGISQSNELSTLAGLNITRIGVNGSSTGPQAGQTINNNLVALSTTYTRGGVARTVGAIDLEANAFFSEIPPEVVDEAGSPVTITQTAAALPQMNGSGMVRNLRAAMSLTGTAADQLEVAVNSFAAATTRDARRAQIDTLITEWAQTSSYWSSLENTLGGTVTVNPPAGMTAAEYRNMIAVLEAFNGSRFYNPVGGAMPAGQWAGTVGGVTHYTITPPAEQVALLKQAYAALKESVYAALVMQTRLKPYLDAIEFVIDENGVSFSTVGLEALVQSELATDAVKGLADLLDLQVNNLVQAMAAFAPPAPGETTLPPSYQTALAPVIAANWN